MLAASLARRSADISPQQLLYAQRVAEIPKPSIEGLPSDHQELDTSMVPYLPRIRRSSSEITAQRLLPTEIADLPLSALTIPEEGKQHSM